jgi:hypothetical protein
MQPPDIKHTLKDAASDVTYHVLAYRRLNRAEVVQAVHVYNSQRRRRAKVKPGTTVTIVTIIGA